MNDRDHIKLMKTGFYIIRADEDKLVIKRKTEDMGWQIFHRGFKNKTALKKTMKKLLEQKYIVED